MPILLVLAVTAACLPVPWPEPPAGPDPVWAAVLTAALVGTPLMTMFALGRWAERTVVRQPHRRAGVLAAYQRGRRWIGVANLAVAGLAVVGGWGWVVQHTLRVTVGGREVLMPGADALVPLPYFVLLAGGWLAYYRAERAFHFTALANVMTSQPPPFWSRPGYVLFHARQFAVLVMLPVALVVTQQGVARLFPETTATWWYRAGSAAGVVGLFVLLPVAVRFALGFRSLPAGPERDQLAATARRLGFGYADLLVWPTRGAVMNAMVLGVVRPFRYVVFTDRLLAALTPAELDAVFGHEAGHVRHRHIPSYAAFFLLSAAAAAAVTVLLDRLLVSAGWLAADGDGSGWFAVPPVLAMAAYVFVVFGLLSRRCERQADVAGARAGSCGDPRCQGHDAGPPTGGWGPVCPTGVRALQHALDRVGGAPPTAGGFFGRLWGLARAWQHGPISDRLLFLDKLAENPALADAADRQADRFRLGLLAGLAVAVAVLGTLAGWEELWRAL